MSPRQRNRNVPFKLMTSKGVTGGEDGHERAGADAGGGVEPRAGGDVESAVRGDVDGRELSPGEAAETAVSGGRGEGAAAPERASRTAGAQGAFRRAGAAGWQFPP